jgi:hypothetical protein
LWFCWSRSECVCLVGPGGDLGFATAILAGWSHRRSLRRIRSPVNLHCAAWAKILSFCNLAKVEHATSGRIGKTPPRRAPPRESRPPSEAFFFCPLFPPLVDVTASLTVEPPCFTRLDSGASPGNASSSLTQHADHLEKVRP